MMGRVPTFSIIVPVYNNEMFLYECIDSLLAQTYTDFELILIDDGSTDRSGEICDEYAEKDLRIKVFHSCNKGVSSARNWGLSVARGKYINFVDSDDWVTQNYLEKYVEAHLDHDYDVVYAEMVRVLDDGIQDIIPLKDFSVISGGDLSEVFVHLLECGELGYACNKSFKREIIETYTITFCENFSLHEDSLFTISYCLHISSIKLLPYATYFYRKGGYSSLELNYDIYHRTILLWCNLLKTLDEKLQADPFNKMVKLYCHKLEWDAVFYMYFFYKGSFSRKIRLCYLKDFKDRFILSKSINNNNLIVKIGMRMRDDRILDCYFYSVAWLSKLKRKILN